MTAHRPTIATSNAHLAMAIHAFRKTASRDEALAVANKHKPYMLESDVKLMREAFAKLIFTR